MDPEMNRLSPDLKSIGAENGGKPRINTKRRAPQWPNNAFSAFGNGVVAVFR
jgi:hypothetical protein